MLAAEFEKVFEAAVAHERETLIKKAAEYDPEGSSRFANFERGSDFLQLPTEVVAWAYLTKHLVSIDDLVSGRLAATPAILREKIGDARNYLVLIEGILLQELARRS